MSRLGKRDHRIRQLHQRIDWSRIVNCFICTTCGTQYAASPTPPARCRVCTDDRQHVGWNGQHWATHAELSATHEVRIEEDGALLGIGIRGGFAIPQRALLVPTSIGNVMWDCISLVTQDAIDTIEQHGGIALIAISHPHFYSAMVEWSDALGGVPILLHIADRDWVMRPSPGIEHWHGDELTLAGDATLVHLPGHFPGSSALHWHDTSNGRRALLTGDSLHVTADRRHVTVMHSVPNYIPVDHTIIHGLQRRLAAIDFDDLYGFTWGRNIIGDARHSVEASLDRYLTAIGRPPETRTIDRA